MWCQFDQDTMPVSEDEVDQKGPSNPSAISKAEQRRSNKPIMEKRRRARINHCLNDLKTLILEAMKKDPARHSKLEKADILEMTVKHLQTVQRQQLAIAVATDPSVLLKFKTGFSECAAEVSRYISRIEGVDPAVRQRLLSHLAHCVNGLQQLTPLTFGAVTAPGLANYPIGTAVSSTLANGGLPSVLPQVPFPAGDVNNNHSRLMNGLQLIPSRLPSGELALLLPSGTHMNGVLPFFSPATTTTATSTATAATAPAIPTATITSATINDRSHPSAFTAVLRCQSPLSTSSGTESQSPKQAASPTSSAPLSGSDTDVRYSGTATITSAGNAFHFPDAPCVNDTAFPSTSWSNESRQSKVIVNHVNHNNAENKDPLDFSIKGMKRPADEVPDGAPPIKMEKAALPYVGMRENAKVVRVEPLRPQRYLLVQDLSQPSTSANKDMWRPW